MRGLSFAAASLLLGSCSVAGPPRDAEYPAIEVPTRLPAAAPTKPPSNASTPPTQTLQRPSPPEEQPDASTRRHGDLPDPQPLSERRQWHYSVRYDRGTIRVGSPTFECLARPRASPRRIGRYAFELWVGAELIERVRFDFPLLAAEEPSSGPRKPLREVPSFARGAQVSVMLDVPQSDRANRARILDRATGDAVEVAWPPPAPPDAGLALCTAPAAGERTSRGDARR